MITAMSHGQVLDEFGFKRVGEFTLTVDFLKYSCDDSYSGGQVYAFVFHRADGERDIVYLGKAGKGVATRLAQHMAGMKGGSKGGHEAASLFREWLASGRAISIWSRVSQAIDVFGIRVTLEDAEETSFLAQITPPPLRNRLKVPRDTSGAIRRAQSISEA